MTIPKTSGKGPVTPRWSEARPAAPAPFVRYGASPDRPNRMLGPHPPAHTVARSGFGVSWQTRSERLDPTHVASLVPNVVLDLGPRKAPGKPFGFAGVTPQPLLGFFPAAVGLPGYRLRSSEAALWRSTLHPAGFYPGDPAGARWTSEFRQRPDATPAIRDAKLLYRSRQDSRNWLQTYLNVPNLFRWWNATSVNVRAIASRREGQLGLYEQVERFVRPDRKTFEVTQSVMTPYAWVQVHLKGGIPNVAQRDRTVYATAPVQVEGGIALYRTTNTLAPLSSRLGPIDWRIVNGLKTSDAAAIEGQFADIRRRFGLTLASESVLPQWDRPTPADRSAGVYLRVPEHERWSARTLARRLHEVGRSMPAYKELRFVTIERILALNPSLRPSGPGGTAGSWLNTGVRVAVGGPGLFLPDAVSPQPAR